MEKSVWLKVVGTDPPRVDSIVAETVESARVESRVHEAGPDFACSVGMRAFSSLLLLIAAAQHGRRGDVRPVVLGGHEGRQLFNAIRQRREWVYRLEVPWSSQPLVPMICAPRRRYNGRSQLCVAAHAVVRHEICFKVMQDDIVIQDESRLRTLARSVLRTRRRGSRVDAFKSGCGVRDNGCTDRDRAHASSIGSPPSFASGAADSLREHVAALREQALVVHEKGRNRVAIAELQEALDCCPKGGEERIELLVEQLRVLRTISRGKRILRTLVALERELGGTEALSLAMCARVLTECGTQLFEFGHYDDSRLMLETATKVSETALDRSGGVGDVSKLHQILFLGRRRYSTCVGLLGDPDSALDELDDVAVEAREAGNVQISGCIRMSALDLLMRRARDRDAGAYLDKHHDSIAAGSHWNRIATPAVRAYFTRDADWLERAFREFRRHRYVVADAHRKLTHFRPDLMLGVDSPLVAELGAIRTRRGGKTASRARARIRAIGRAVWDLM